MVELLIGKKGTGKTKHLIDNVNASVNVAKGNVVFISNDTSRNMYDISSKVRMADTSEFDIESYSEFLGFICGIVSGNFDITNIFVCFSFSNNHPESRYLRGWLCSIWSHCRV